MAFKPIASNKDSILFVREGTPDLLYYFYNRMTHKKFILEILKQKEQSGWTWAQRGPCQEFWNFQMREGIKKHANGYTVEKHIDYPQYLEWDDWHRLRKDPTPWIVEALL